MRVAVSASALEHGPGGHGRLWRATLAELERLADIRYVKPGRRRLPLRADVWMADGYEPPPPPGLPVVAYLAEAPWQTPEAIEGIDPRFVEFMAGRGRPAVARADRVTVPARTSLEQVVDVYGVAPERVDVVPLGVDLGTFAGGRPEAGRARVGSPYVLFVGQTHPRKNAGALREAMALLAASGIRRTLAMVAHRPMDRPDSDALLAAAVAPIDGVEVVHLHHLADAEVADLLAGADAYCLPSLFEGFGLTALEAMAAGAPVVAAARGALPEVVGEAGLIVEPEPEPLARALARVLTDTALADRLRAAGRARAAGLTWAHTARGWLASLERAIADAQAAGRGRR